jgi:hypothetical protein
LHWQRPIKGSVKFGFMRFHFCEIRLSRQLHQAMAVSTSDGAKGEIAVVFGLHDLGQKRTLAT